LRAIASPPLFDSFELADLRRFCRSAGQSASDNKIGEITDMVKAAPGVKYDKGDEMGARQFEAIATDDRPHDQGRPGTEIRAGPAFNNLLPAAESSWNGERSRSGPLPRSSAGVIPKGTRLPIPNQEMKQIMGNFAGRRMVPVDRQDANAT
jgi:hypothetical protein